MRQDLPCLWQPSALWINTAGRSVALISVNGGREVMNVRALGFAALGLIGLALGGCVESTLAPSSDANLKPRDRQLLANAPYAQVSIPEQYQRHIVSYHRREAPGTIVIDSDSKFLYYVMPQGKAIRYGVTVGEEALAWSGVAKIGRMEEWPSWTPTAEIPISA